MSRCLSVATVLAAILTTLAAGCGQTVFEAALGPTLEQVDYIRESQTLDPQEKRQALADFGISEVTINGLLQAERLANQFGGDLSSAYDKVANDQLGQMTPDEVQYYGDATAVTTYADQEAQAIVEFFGDNDIESVDELEDVLDDPTIELPSAIDDANLRGVFIDTSLADVRDELP